MKIIIDITEKVYTYLTRECSGLVDDGSDSILLHLAKGVIKGTPLPKGHGDLVDRDTITVEEDVYFQNYIIHAPTVIPADNSKVD